MYHIIITTFRCDGRIDSHQLSSRDKSLNTVYFFSKQLYITVNTLIVITETISNVLYTLLINTATSWGEMRGGGEINLTNTMEL